MNFGFNGFSSTPAVTHATDYAAGIVPTSDVSFNNIGNITDSNNNTMGDSASAAASQYVQVDLGQARRIQSMSILYADQGHTSVYGSLQYSQDAVTWTNAVVWSNDQRIGRNYIVNATGRYWRHQSTQAYASGTDGINIMTWNLFG